MSITTITKELKDLAYKILLGSVLIDADTEEGQVSLFVDEENYNKFLDLFGQSILASGTDDETNETLE